MGVLSEMLEDEGHPEPDPDCPDSDPSPYDILREAVEIAVADLTHSLRIGELAAVYVSRVVDRLDRAMYLAAGGAE